VEDDDVELLVSYECDGDESAFAHLVKRHSPWIFAAARRRLGDDHLADDATQAIFVVLADKAPLLVESRRGSLSAWLFHVMHFTCARLRRSKARQTHLERLAGTARATEDQTETVAEGPLLVLMEDSIAQVSAVEREMIVRRFYRNQSFTQIGLALNTTAEAARKRVSRSLARIKKLMLQDGVDAIPDALLLDVKRSTTGSSDRAKRAMNKKQIDSILKDKIAMAEQNAPPAGGYQLISAEFLVRDVEANLEFFENLGFPRRFVDTPDSNGRIPRASLTAGKLGKIWIRRALESEIHPSPSINVFFWIDGGPQGLIAHRRKIADKGVAVSPVIDEHSLPNFNVTTPDGYSIAFFTQYVAPDQSPVVLVL
jgi:RNA polymerase sigma factor (sigma-70 family)